MSDVQMWMRDAGFSAQDASLIEGVFVEKGVYLTTEDPDAKDAPEKEQPQEWIERQEERRAWAIGESVRYLRDTIEADSANLISTATAIEAFVKGDQEDPDLHDQDALDNFGVVMTQILTDDLAEGIKSDAHLEMALNHIQNQLTIAGVRFKNGKVLEN